MDIFKWLDDASLIDSYSINDFRKSESAFYLNVKIIFTDNSELHAREYIDADHRKYSFHWQTLIGTLIARWDNAPHFQGLVTFPHHKHLASGQVVESHDISFDEVLTLVQYQIQKQ
jgi:hypothetical protein